MQGIEYCELTDSMEYSKADVFFGDCPGCQLNFRQKKNKVELFVCGDNTLQCKKCGTVFNLNGEVIIKGGIDQ